MALHMYYLVRTVWLFLSCRFGNRYFTVYEWCMKTEYQGRGTPHWHICAWLISHGLLKFLSGRTGTAVVSSFVKFLQLLFCAEIDVQIGNGRINYINGYVAKDHDAVDVGLGEYVQKDATSSWLSTYSQGRWEDQSGMGTAPFNYLIPCRAPQGRCSPLVLQTSSPPQFHNIPPSSYPRVPVHGLNLWRNPSCIVCLATALLVCPRLRFVWRHFQNGISRILKYFCIRLNPRKCSRWKAGSAIFHVVCMECISKKNSASLLLPRM